MDRAAGPDSLEKATSTDTCGVCKLKEHTQYIPNWVNVATSTAASTPRSTDEDVDKDDDAYLDNAKSPLSSS